MTDAILFILSHAQFDKVNTIADMCTKKVAKGEALKRLLHYNIKTSKLLLVKQNAQQKYAVIEIISIKGIM